jgi:hypothetical protein
LSNRIPPTRAAISAALAAIGARQTLATDEASIRIWQITPQGEVSMLHHVVHLVHQALLGGRTFFYDQGVLDQLAAMRQAHLPKETGGVLLGIADMIRKSIHVVMACPRLPTAWAVSPGSSEASLASRTP